MTRLTITMPRTLRAFGGAGLVPLSSGAELSRRADIHQVVVVLRGIMIVCLIAGSYGLICLPAYVIAERSRVRGPGIAFVPFVGQTLALLRSIGRSGWLVLLTFVPLFNFAFWIWLMFALPSYHRRTLLWGLVLLVPVLGMYPYAFTLRMTAPKGRQTFTAVTRG